MDDDLHVVYGHVSLDEAAQMVRAETGWPDHDSECEIDHTYARRTPLPPSSSYDFLFRCYVEKGRGAFPVTVVRPKEHAQ